VTEETGASEEEGEDTAVTGPLAIKSSSNLMIRPFCSFSPHLQAYYYEPVFWEASF
jgi:hypothetical protein